MLRRLALALLLLHAHGVQANHSRTFNDVQHLLHALHHDHRLQSALQTNIAFAGYEYDVLNWSAIIQNGPRTVLPSDLLVFVENLTPKMFHRYKRESHSLIGTYDISKMFKKRKFKNKQNEELQPSASSLQGGQPQLIGSEPSFVAAPSTQPVLTSDPGVRIPGYSEDSTLDDAQDHGTQQPVPTLKGNVFTIPALLIPTENYNTMTTKTSHGPDKAKSKPISTRKSKSVMKMSTNAPNNIRREARLVAKKKVSENETLWPVKLAAVVEGDIVLGGLMMVSTATR